MKKFFFFAVAALALAACSNDETVEVNQGEAISFRALTTNVTRASDVNLPTSGFFVTALKKDQAPSPANTYFDNIQFKYNGGNYYSDNKYYWPGTYNLDFYAYAPETGTDLTRTDYKTFTVKSNATVSSQIDFVYAVAKDWGTYTGVTNDGKNGVSINFRHAESKVAIKLKNSNPNLTFEVGDVVLGNIYDQGVFTSALSSTVGDGNLTNAEWGSLTTSGTDAYTASFTQTFSGSISSSATQVGEDMILIPQTLHNATAYSGTAASSTFSGAYISAQLKIKNTANNDYIINDGSSYLTAIWPLQADQWVPGYKYTYTVDLAGGGYYSVNQDAGDDDLDPILEGAEIKFVTVTVDSWDEVDKGIISNLTVAKGSTNTYNITNEAGTYYISVTGLTAASSVAVTGTVNCTSPTVTTPVGTSGTAVVTCNVSAGTGTSVITVTESGAGSSTTVINLVQTAP